VARLFIIDGAKALSKAIRRTFGRAAAIQRCQIRFTRRATSWSDCLSRCMPRFAACCDKHGSWTTPPRPKGCFATSPSVSNETGRGVAGSILEGIDEILTVTRLGLPKELRRSLASDGKTGTADRTIPVRDSCTWTTSSAASAR
jgi:hypothetical protein